MAIIKDAKYWKDYRDKKKMELQPVAEIPIERVEAEDFPPHKCIQTVGGKTVYVEDPNYAKMCQYVHCRKPSIGTTEVFRQHLRVCAYHKELVEWVDPKKKDGAVADIEDRGHHSIEIEESDLPTIEEVQALFK